jgi:hypothetical protein
MQNTTAASAATLEELAAEVAALRARLDGHTKAVKALLTPEEILRDLVEMDELPPRPRPRLRLVASCYTGRKRTAPRGKLKLVGGAA